MSRPAVLRVLARPQDPRRRDAARRPPRRRPPFRQTGAQTRRGPPRGGLVRDAYEMRRAGGGEREGGPRIISMTKESNQTPSDEMRPEYDLRGGVRGTTSTSTSWQTSGGRFMSACRTPLYAACGSTKRKPFLVSPHVTDWIGWSITSTSRTCVPQLHARSRSRAGNASRRSH